MDCFRTIEDKQQKLEKNENELMKSNDWIIAVQLTEVLYLQNFKCYTLLKQNLCVDKFMYKQLTFIMDQDIKSFVK